MFISYVIILSFGDDPSPPVLAFLFPAITELLYGIVSSLIIVGPLEGGIYIVLIILKNSRVLNIVSMFDISYSELAPNRPLSIVQL